MSESTALTVSQLTRYLKRKFERDPYLQRVYVVGEVSNFRHRPNGHQYFSLKDEQAKIRVSCFKPVFDKLGWIPEEGMTVMAIGRISLYEPSGDYQLVVEHMEVAGVGALQQALRELHERLSGEGLFDSERKKRLPAFPQRIAVLTSPSGAVIHDIQTTVMRRFPLVQLVLFPTVVQGKESVASIIANLQKVYAKATEFDLIILARGGGSIEDLWAFNDERVVRTIAERPIPLISSIGHETDTTLADLVADMRAPTPTAAAEMAVPVLTQVLLDIGQWQQRAQRAMQVRLTQVQQRLQRVMRSYLFQQPERMYEGYSQKHDMTVQRLWAVWQQRWTMTQHRLEHAQRLLHLNQPTTRIHTLYERVQLLQQQLAQQQQYTHQQRQHRLAQAVQALDLLSPLKRMSQGYAHVRVHERPLTSVADAAVGDLLAVQLHDGLIQASVTAVTQQDSSE